MEILRFIKHRLLQRKVAGIFIFLLLIFVSPKAFSGNVVQDTLRVSFRDATLEEVIDYLEAKTKYRFLYEASDINLTQSVTASYKGRAKNVIFKLFGDLGIDAIIRENQVILKNIIYQDELMVLSGIVTDMNGIPLPNAHVLVNDLRKGTITDANGKYKINVHKGDILSFCYIGFKTYNYVVENKTLVNIKMQENLSELDEVVIGYGEQRRENVSAAISSSRGDVIRQNMQIGTTFDKGLDGLMKGVFITQGTGELGNNADINIRGITSPFGKSNNNPLFVIDGVALFVNSNGEYDKGDGLNFNPLESISSEDIESIDVLKDAAATAIYGSRGANGVIIVKTKKGRYNQPTSVSLSWQTSLGRPIKTFDYLKTEDFKKYILALNKNSYDYYLANKTIDKYYGDRTLSLLESFGFKNSAGGFIYEPKNVKFGNADTDWNDVVYRKPAIANSINIGINGGGNDSFYNFTFGYINQEGILKADKLERYNSRLNYNFKISETIKAGALINFSKSQNKSGFSAINTATGGNELGSDILKFRPDIPIYGKGSKLTYDNVGTKDFPIYKVNPLGMTTLSNLGNKVNYSFLGNVFTEWDITPELSFRFQYSLHLLFGDTKIFQPKEFKVEGYEKSTQSELSTANMIVSNMTVDYTAKYLKSFGNHTITGLLGFSHNKDESDLKFYRYKGFINSQVGTEVQDAKKTYSKTRQVLPSALNSFFGRFSYNYSDKLGLLLSLRLDRSSKFAKRNRNAWFPAISTYWNIHNEDFMLDSFFEELKLRLSYGFTGSTNLEEFQYKQFYQSGRDKYNGELTLVPTETLANERIRWEKTREVNFGVDFTFSNYIIYGSLDLYYKKTTDVIANTMIIFESGYDSFTSNYASLSNKGIELSLSSDIITNEDFLWKINFNASRNLNKILSLSKAIKKSGASNYYVVGRETNIIRGFIADGIIQEQKTIDELNKTAKAKGHSFYYSSSTGPGDYLYRDISGPKGVPDGKVDDYDREIIGTRQPDLFGGFNTSLRYKNFNLGIYFSYSLGVDSFRADEDTQFAKFNNVESYMAPQFRWSPTNKTAGLPRLIHRKEGGNNLRSTANLFDASYLRLTSINLGYDLPESIVGRMGLRKFSIYASATNLYTWTNFPGLDPQGASGGYASDMNNTNYDTYPSAKTFSIGVKIQY